MIKACYSDLYYVETKSRSMEKLAAVARAVEERGLAELVDPGVIDIELLRELHDPDLVDDFLVGRKPLATLQGFAWDKKLRDGVLSIQAGQLCAASLAFFHGVSANIAQGFHHAGYDYGSGFCTFNGLALVAKQYPDKKIFVLDCDQHGGNGTAEFTEILENLFNFTIFGLRFGCRDFDRSIGRKISRKMGEGSFELYKKALQEGLEKIIEWDTDLIIYQAGTDCHQHDPFGSEWFDTESLFERDRMVFEFAKSRGIPLMFVLAGGYQQMQALTELHANTFVAAKDVYSRHQL